LGRMTSGFVLPFCFRQAADEAELEQLFRLRYRVFSTDREIRELVAGASGEIDLVPHDLCAIHYGVFDLDGRALAAARAIGGQASHQTPMVRQVVRTCGLSLPPVLDPFPILSYFHRKALETLVQAQLAAGLRVVECGRLCVDPAAGAARAHVFRFLAECTLAAELCDRGVDVIYGMSTIPLFRYYRRLGFVAVPNLPTIEAFSTRVRAVLSLLEREKLTPATVRRLAERADELRRHGQIQAAFERAPHAA
jgi:N-acyl-L-homoserine lactone synthetase